MQKLFSLFAATLFAVTMFAADDFVVALSDMTKTGNSYITADLNKKAIKKAHVYVELPSENVEGTFTVVASDNQAARFLYIYKNGGAVKDESRAMVMSKEVATICFTSSDVMVRDDNKPYLHFYTEDDFKVKTFGYTYEEITSDPVLNVDKESVELNAVAANPAPKAEVTFSGKNLAAGNYTLVVPNLSGLYVNPASVTVGEDGKLNAKVVIRFAPTADVEAGSTKVSLTIGALTKEVAIAYSATFDTNYEYGTSVNIEQWVLDNGKDNQAFQAALQAAHIDFENINELDSLNDEKTARNEPYLGLKLKKAGASVGLWVKQGSSIRLKLGFVGDNVIVSANGEEATITPDQWAQVAGKLEITNVPYDCYMKLTTTSDKTVVIKQIMIDEPIAEVTLPDSPTPSAIANTTIDTKVAKRIVNGQVIIELNGKTYNAQGVEVR